VEWQLFLYVGSAVATSLVGIAAYDGVKAAVRRVRDHQKPLTEVLKEDEAERLGAGTLALFRRAMGFTDDPAKYVVVRSDRVADGWDVYLGLELHDATPFRASLRVEQKIMAFARLRGYPPSGVMESRGGLPPDLGHGVYAAWASVAGAVRMLFS
jgi:hypothetical protein